MAICRQGNASVDLQSRFAWNRFYELKAAIEEKQRSDPPIDDAAEWRPERDGVHVAPHKGGEPPCG